MSDIIHRTIYEAAVLRGPGYGLSLSTEAAMALLEQGIECESWSESGPYVLPENVTRSDPRLISVLKALGSKADHNYENYPLKQHYRSRISIVTIEVSVETESERTDGVESVRAYTREIDSKSLDHFDPDEEG